MLDLFEKNKIQADREFISQLPKLVQFQLREEALNDLADEVIQEMKTLRYDHNPKTLSDCLARLRDPMVIHALRVSFGADAEIFSIEIQATVKKNKTTQPPQKRRAAGGGRKKKVDLTSTRDMFGGDRV